jgi:hypothetical protein
MTLPALVGAFVEKINNGLRQEESVNEARGRFAKMLRTGRKTMDIAAGES